MQRPVDTDDPLDAGWRDRPPDLMNLLRIVRRQSLLVAFSTLLCLSMGFAYIIVAVPFYAAQASMTLSRSAGGEPLAESATVIDLELDTHVELIRSDETAAAVIDELDLEESPNFAPQQPGRLETLVAGIRDWLQSDFVDESLAPENRLPGVIRMVKEGLHVARVGNTRVIDVSYTSWSPELAVSIANAFARAHLEVVATRDSRSSARRIERLETRAEEVRQLAASADASVQKLLQSSDRFAADPQELQDQTAELRRQLARLDAEGAGLSIKLSLINVYSETGDVLAFVLDTPESIRLLNDLRLAEQRLEEVRQRPNVSKEMVALVESGLESFRASLNHEARLEANAVRVQLEVNKAERESLTNQIAELRSYIQSKTWSQLEAGRRDWAFYEGVYQDYLTRIEAAYREPQARFDLRMVSEALPPMSPSSPNQKVVLALSVTIGVFLGIGLAMLREWNLHARSRR